MNVRAAAVQAAPVYMDLARIAEENMSLDVTGHYSRPDIFELKRRS